ncbi:hypothetical protein N7510_004382 [Penicillium lagena]|uniref:uncharacterized protein n=1 Tax=Penicillium lagena TaxID=94218 RepID=UPI00253FF8C4|nr:uncharacterized protein N7510_004382 [Penicillium lagena]KAJ5620398.1 hypothetical protein N7510_004382 [Penicillium lagena]
MASSIYDGTILTAKGALEALANILHIGEKQPNANALLAARLADDMKPLTFQVYTVTRFSEMMVARLTGREKINYEDNFSSFAEMYQRIDQVLKALNDADKDEVNKRGDQSEMTFLPSLETEMTGAAMAYGICIPNVLFHVNMAYAIMRKEGVPLGKRDYIMPFLTKHVTI